MFLTPLIQSKKRHTKPNMKTSSGLVERRRALGRQAKFKSAVKSCALSVIAPPLQEALQDAQPHTHPHTTMYRMCIGVKRWWSYWWEPGVFVASHSLWFEPPTAQAKSYFLSFALWRCSPSTLFSSSSTRPSVVHVYSSHTHTQALSCLPDRCPQGQVATRRQLSRRDRCMPNPFTPRVLLLLLPGVCRRPDVRVPSMHFFFSSLAPPRVHSPSFHPSTTHKHTPQGLGQLGV